MRRLLFMTVGLALVAGASGPGCSGDRKLEDTVPTVDADVSTPPDSARDTDLDDDALPDADDVCDEMDLAVSRVTPRILIVLDRSGSMSDGGYWEPVRSALYEITRALQHKIAFGLMLFPNTEGRRACDVPDYVCEPADDPVVRCRAGSAGRIANTLEETDTCGGTPTAPTLEAAADYFVEYDSPSRVPTAQASAAYVLLATDGAPNCNASLNGSTCRCTGPPESCEAEPRNCLDDEETFEAIEELREAGVTLFVLGIAASSWRDVLNDMAELGGTGGAFMAHDLGSIQGSLEEITEGLTTCEVAVGDPSPLADPELVNFYVDDELVPMNTETRCDSGWMWTDETHRRVIFCGDHCELLRTGAVDLVRATFGCPTLI